MVEIFKALSDETRLRILSLLLEGEMCVCEIEKYLNLSQSNASRHLTSLKNAGILESEKKAQWAYYKLSDDFCTDHVELFSYLKVRLKMLRHYDNDISQLRCSKVANMCDEGVLVYEQE